MGKNADYRNFTTPEGKSVEGDLLMELPQLGHAVYGLIESQNRGVSVVHRQVQIHDSVAEAVARIMSAASFSLPELAQVFGELHRQHTSMSG